jgi:hypothetical protein
MIEHRKTSWFLTAALAGLAACVLVTLVLITPVPQAWGQSGTAPQYTSSGELQTPSGFETWVFVGSNLGLGYDNDLALTTPQENAHAEQQVFHNIYINPEAYAHFVATHEFPDPTVLIMEVFTAAGKEPKGVVTKGVFDGERIGLQVAVKDSRCGLRKLPPGACEPRQCLGAVLSDLAEAAEMTRGLVRAHHRQRDKMPFTGRTGATAASPCLPKTTISVSPDSCLIT